MLVRSTSKSTFLVRTTQRERIRILGPAVYFEAILNNPVDCVLLGVSGAWWFIAFKRMKCPSAEILWLKIIEVALEPFQTQESFEVP